jgi:hypothetical protein
VRDEDGSHPQATLEFLEYLQNLSLDGDVERGEGFVGHDHLGVARKRAGDADSLTLPTTQLVGEAMGLRRTEANGPQEVSDPIAKRSLRQSPAYAQGQADDTRHGLVGIQGGEGVLEDHLQALPQRTHLAGTERGQVKSLQQHSSLGRRFQAAHKPGERALPAAALADETKGLPSHDLQRHPVHRANYMPAQAVTSGHCLYPEHGTISVH